MIRKIKQLEVERGEHVPQCPLAGDANDSARRTTARDEGKRETEEMLLLSRLLKTEEGNMDCAQ